MLDPNVLNSSPVSPLAMALEEPAAQAIAAPSAEIGDLYVQHRSLLVHIACRKFRVPEADAEALLQEVFVSLMTTTTKVENVRAWLVAAMCNASRHYWRGQSRTERLPEDFGDHGDPGSQGIADRFAMSITMRQALDYLQDRCRQTLYLHYYEGRSAPEVARELQTTTRYAEKLIHNCLKRVREIYFNITAVKR